MLPFLRAEGYEPTIAFEPESATETPDLSGVADRMLRQGVSIAYFQKVYGPSVLEEVSKLRRAGVPTIYGVCDRVEEEMVRAADATVIVTEFLRSLHDPQLQSRIFIVHDGIERPEVRRGTARPASSRDLRAILVTSSRLESIPVLGRLPRNFDLTVVGDYEEQSPLAALRQRLQRRWHSTENSVPVPLLGYGFRAKPWHKDRVYEDLVAADVGIIPVDMRPDPSPGSDVSRWEVKSENRLTLMMAAGLPVIASPVPSYLDVIVHGVNGYIAHDRADWLAAIDALRDPAHRERVGTTARASVLERFSMQSQARRLLSVLDALNVRRDEHLQRGSD